MMFACLLLAEHFYNPKKLFLEITEMVPFVSILICWLIKTYFDLKEKTGR